MERFTALPDMSFNVINIVTNVQRINLGVWKAALVGSRELLERQQVRSFLWVFDDESRETLDVPPGTTVRFLTKHPSDADVYKQLNADNLLPDNSVVVTHGSWLKPTRIGFRLQQQGFSWIYVPQGMLESWSMRQGWLKKQLYFHVFEKRFARNASYVRAVSVQEEENLKKHFGSKVTHVPNGVTVPIYSPKTGATKTYLFMARLHQKKGIVPLVKAWTKVMKNAPAKLIIAGPDEGELSKFHHFLGGNVVYLGPVYGDEKVKLLNEAHYYVLPSFSEGFPSSVLEAMSFGAIPLISKGCNFPEVFDQKLGYNIEPDEISIGKVLSMLRVRDYDTAKSHENHLFIKEGYAESRIAEKLFALYSQCIRSLKVRNTHAFIL